MTVIKIVFYISLIAFIGLFVLIKILKLISRKTTVAFEEDENYKVKKNPESTDALYFSHGTAYKYIPKYAICKSGEDKYVVCNYAKQFKKIYFFIVCYNKKNKIIDSYLYKEENVVTNTSKMIIVKRNTAKINIIIANVDDAIINNDAYLPLKKGNIALHSLLVSLDFFAFLMSLRYIIAKLFCNDFYGFMKSFGVYLLFIAIAVSAILFIVLIVSINKRNSKYVQGGSLEYEFI